MDPYDALILGGGPAGLTAALHRAAAARRASPSGLGRPRHLAWHQRKVLVIDCVTGPLFFTLEKLWNVPGMPEATGSEIQKRLKSQAESVGARIQYGTGFCGRAPGMYDPSVQRQTILLALVLCTCAACAGGRAPSPRTAPAEPRTAPAGPTTTALDVLRAREPGTEWDGKSLLHADLDLDGGEDYALAGLREDRFVVGIVHGPLSGDSSAGSQVWTLDFPWDGDEDALCSKKAKITLEPLEENEGPKPGHPREGMGINLSDEQCDAFHIYWNPREKTFEYWRL